MSLLKAICNASVFAGAYLGLCWLTGTHPSTASAALGLAFLALWKAHE